MAMLMMAVAVSVLALGCMGSPLRASSIREDLVAAHVELQQDRMQELSIEQLQAVRVARHSPSQTLIPDRIRCSILQPPCSSLHNITVSLTLTADCIWLPCLAPHSSTPSSMTMATER